MTRATQYADFRDACRCHSPCNDRLDRRGHTTAHTEAHPATLARPTPIETHAATANHTRQAPANHLLEHSKPHLLWQLRLRGSVIIEFGPDQRRHYSRPLNASPSSLGSLPTVRRATFCRRLAVIARAPVHRYSTSQPHIAASQFTRRSSPCPRFARDSSLCCFGDTRSTAALER